jgi:hypothetical protein
MDIATLIDGEVMAHLSLYGCVKNMDPYAQYLLKTSEHPVFRFRRNWMRATALRQHLEAERRQVKRNDVFKGVILDKKATIRQEAVLDPHLAQEMRHYNGASLNDKTFLGDLRREAPNIFPRRNAI